MCRGEVRHTPRPTQTLEAIKPRFRAATPELLARWNTDRNKAGAWAMVDVMWAMREFDHVGSLKRLAGPAAAILGARGNALSNRPICEESIMMARHGIVAGCAAVLAALVPVTATPQADTVRNCARLVPGVLDPCLAPLIRLDKRIRDF